MNLNRMRSVATAIAIITFGGTAAAGTQAAAASEPSDTTELEVEARYEIIRYSGIGDFYNVKAYDYMDGDEEVCSGWGLIDATGREVIPCIYRSRFEVWKNGYSAAELMDEDYAYNVVDTLGNQYAIDKSVMDELRGFDIMGSDEPGVCYIGIYGDQTSIVRYPDNKVVTRLPGSIGVHGNIAQNRIPVYTYKANGSERCGFYDLSGREVVPLDYWMTGSYSEGLASVMMADVDPFDEDDSRGYCELRVGFIDLDGNVVIPLEYFDEYVGESSQHDELGGPEFSDGLCAVTDGKHYLLIDTLGRRVFDDPDCDGIYSFENGRARVVFKEDSNKKSGYIDRSGRMLDVEDDHAAALDFEVFYNSEFLHGYRDAAGLEVIPCRYPEAFDFDSNYAIVSDPETGLFGLIDASGRMVVSNLAESASR